MAMSGDAQKLFDDPKKFLFEEKENTYNSVENITLYFKSEDKLVKEKRVLNRTFKDLPTAVFDELVKGPENNNLNGIIPPGTELIWAKIDGTVCTLNFNKSFLNNMPDDSLKTKLTIYGIVNTFTQLPEIESVMFLIQNEEYDTVNDINIDKPISPDTSFAE